MLDRKLVKSVVQRKPSAAKHADEREHIEALSGIRRGLDQAKKGAGRPVREFMREMAAEHGVQIPK